MYTLDSDVCVHRTLCAYLDRTQTLPGSETRLILSYIKTHGHVASTTVSRWIKIVMKNSGIDVEKFSSHSTRSAASSKVKQCGVPITEIMKVAGWSTDQTFSHFYDKPLETSNEGTFQDAVLQ